jgi:TolA-binding protein
MCLLTGCLFAGTVAAQYIQTEQSQVTLAGTTERTLATARTQYDQEAFVAALQTLETLDATALTRAQRSEKERLEACIAFQTNPVTSLPILKAYLENWPDAQEKNYMNALLAQAYYANKDCASVVNLMNRINPDKLGLKDMQQLILNYAMALVGLGQNDEARLQLATVSAISEEFANEVAFANAYIDYTERAFDKAIQGFDTVMDDMRFRSRALYFSAQAAMESGKNEAADEFASLYLGQFSKEEYAVEACRIKGEALYGMGNYDKAAPTLEIYLNESKEPAREALLKLGLSEYNIGAFLRAPEIFALISENDDAVSQSAHLYSGLSFLKTDDKARARMELEQAASMTADNALREQAMYNYIVCLHEMNYSAFGEAVTMFERFLNEFPESQYADQANVYLAETYMNTRNYAAALESIEKIRQPGTAILAAKQKLLYKAGLEAFVNRLTDEAFEKFTQSLQLSKYDKQTAADAYFWRGESHYRKGNFSKAASDYQQHLSNTANKGSREYLLALYGLGYSKFRRADYNGAYTSFDRFVTSSNVVNTIDRATVSDAWSRIGDCYFQARQFTNAERSYDKAINVDPSTCDYAVYQKAFAQGLLGRYDDKISTLSYLTRNFPLSDYADDAIYEKGRSYVQLERGAQAQETFRELLEKYPESVYAPAAGNQIALIYYQNDNIRAAIDTYKKVILNYPGSEQANVAMRDLKSLHVEENMVEDYVEFATQAKSSVVIDVTEHDSLAYTAAEQAYMRNETKTATEGFLKYLQQFPNGAYTLIAHYHLGCIYSAQNMYEEALTHLQPVAAVKSCTWCEDATSRIADMAYNRRDFNLALSSYKDLKTITMRSDTRLHAQTNLVRSAWALQDQDLVINEVGTFLDDAKLAPETAIEMRYYRAKSYLAQKLTKTAQADLALLAKDTRNIYGAEAKYLLAQLYFDNRQLDKAEKEVLDYINVSTPHSYWLARSFILLADVYMSSDRNIEAKQYLLSLRQNYQANDDIASMIETRLARLE